MDTTEKFTGLAQIYAAHRPSYPKELLDHLAHRCGLSVGSAVADVGAGTGILTRELLDRGYEVWAVEPNSDMRGEAANALEGAKNLHLVSATAEDTGLPDGRMALVTAAQAFHWFNTERFRVECGRILAPGGAVALIWNSRVAEHPIHRENAEICQQYCPRFQGFSGGIDSDSSSIDRFFASNGYEYSVFPNDLKLNLDGFLGRGLSSSYAPRPGEDTYEPYLQALSDLFHRWSCGDWITLPNQTCCYLGWITRA